MSDSVSATKLISLRSLWDCLKCLIDLIISDLRDNANLSRVYNTCFDFPVISRLLNDDGHADGLKCPINHIHEEVHKNRSILFFHSQFSDML